VHLVKNGVDTKMFRPKDRAAARRSLGLDGDGPVVVFCGRLEPQKGLADLLVAFDEVRRRRPDVRLVLLGDGVMRAEVAARVAKLGGALVAPGARPLAEVAEWIGAADVFTLPSHAEGTPNVVLEALASGRPVVGSRVGGIPDCLADERSGVLVPAKNPRALADGLLAALERRWDEDAIVSCGPGSWDESAARLYDVMAETLAARAHPRVSRSRSRSRPSPAPDAVVGGATVEPAGGDDASPVPVTVAGAATGPAAAAAASASSFPPSRTARSSSGTSP